MFIDEIVRKIINRLRSNSRSIFEMKRIIGICMILDVLCKDNYPYLTVEHSRNVNHRTKLYAKFTISKDLLPSNITTLTDYQTKRYLKTICNLYNKQSRLDKLIFSFLYFTTPTYFFLYIYSPR